MTTQSHPAAAILPAIPGAIGAIATITAFGAFDLASISREVEAIASIAFGLLAWGSASVSLRMISLRESSAETMLETLGVEADRATIRLASMASGARESVERMDSALSTRSEELRAAFAELKAALAPLLDEIVTSPATAGRSDALLRRSLPRLEEAVTTFAKHAERSDELVDLSVTRARLIEAVEQVRDQALGARKAALRSSERDVDVAIEVLEASLPETSR